MTMASRLPATMTFMSLVASWLVVGLITNRPSTRPMRTAAMGPFHGMSESTSAVEAPRRERTSGSFSLSCESTVAITWVSQLKPFGKSGRRGRSIRREVRISFSAGRPSRLKKPPGIFPAAKVFSW